MCVLYKRHYNKDKTTKAEHVMKKKNLALTKRGISITLPVPTLPVLDYSGPVLPGWESSLLTGPSSGPSCLALPEGRLRWIPISWPERRGRVR